METRIISRNTVSSHVFCLLAAFCTIGGLDKTKSGRSCSSEFRLA